MKFLEELLKVNSKYEDERIKTDSLNSGKFHIEISAIPEQLGGGFYVTVPALGRWFAQSDGSTILEALEDLDGMLRELITDQEHTTAYAEVNITVPPIQAHWGPGICHHEKGNRQQP